ncbi:hypothetical protein B5S31_g4871 [[Candida] boidinii]|uniref:Unnamed protein product n=1 Tax=Candida boidinii TaxID=5477 RepID=A0ACB5TKH1_CANBO|nr:hypothetical protein B5S31_g4871 [[Candida] boidinii]OWB80679.1 hypothetical protein B5S32_g4972 [[Candida] boidinii]GME89925.1 unnamed protein product [[Candida] boidinii]
MFRIIASRGIAAAAVAAPSSNLVLKSTTRFISTTGTDPTSILDELQKRKTLSKKIDSEDPFKNILGQSALNLKTEQRGSAFEYASLLPPLDKHNGRSIRVKKGSYGRAVGQLNTLVRTNELKSKFFEQRFFTKPNKVKLNKRIVNKKKRFDAGIAKLFSVVKDAVRKGY